MKNKTIITIAACMLFMLAAFSAFAGERVYIREYNFLGSTEAFIYEKGTVTKKEFAQGLMTKAGKEGNLKEFAELLEGYFNKGFKIVSVANLSTGASSESIFEYILEKQ